KKSNKMRRSPLFASQAGSSAGTGSPAAVEKDTPKRPREMLSPDKDQRAAPPKKNKAGSPPARNEECLMELGTIVYELLSWVTEKNKRHISAMQRSLITRLKDIHSILVGSAPEEHAQPVIMPKPVCPRCERAGIDTVEKEQQTLPTEVWTQDQAVQTGSIPNSTGPWSAHRKTTARDAGVKNRRRLLVSVASAQILYAAPIWAEAMNTPSYRRGVDAVYRLGAIRVASGFRTVSDDAILVIGAMVPLKERARDFKELKETRARNEGAGGTPNTAAREDAKERSLTAWQDCWDASTKGRWTHTLIPNLRRWVLRSHGQVDFYLTQVLSGHGCFRQ
ncbi:hypothetical protein KR074_001673, partial [Drosophila pseudoananassae]